MAPGQGRNFLLPYLLQLEKHRTRFGVLGVESQICSLPDVVTLGQALTSYSLNSGRHLGWWERVR